MFNFILSSLAVWRLSSLFAREDGPFEIFTKFRYFVGVRYADEKETLKEFIKFSHDGKSESYGTNQFATGLICVWCNSLWISIFVSLLLATSFTEWIVYTLALSAMTTIIDRITG